MPALIHSFKSSFASPLSMNRQARQLCGNVKDFFNLFRPDRRQLVDCGVPVEFIYLIEDQLLKGNS